MDSCGQREFRCSEVHIVYATAHSLDKGHSTEQQEVQAGAQRAPSPAHYSSLLTGDFLVVEFGDARYGERVADCRNPSRETDLPQSRDRVPLPRDSGRKHYPGLYQTSPAGRILFEPKELCEPSRLPMVSDNLVVCEKRSGDCAGFQAYPFLPTALALRVSETEG